MRIKSGFVRGPMLGRRHHDHAGLDHDDAGRSLAGAGGPDRSCTAGAAKVNDVAPDATAFVHRNADFLFKCEVIWAPEDDPDLIAANLEWLEGYHAAMQPYLSGGAYQNFPDRTQVDWQHAYYGENFPRLVETKRTWDPDNLFRFPQSIPVSLSLPHGSDSQANRGGRRSPPSTELTSLNDRTLRRVLSGGIIPNARPVSPARAASTRAMNAKSAACGARSCPSNAPRS